MEKIENYALVVSLFQEENEGIMEQLLKIRAIDQKATADYLTESFFHHLFKPECSPRYNNFIYVTTDVNPKKIYHLAKEKELKSFEEEIAFDTGTYLKREIDGIVLLNVQSEDREQYIEIKLFTVPYDDVPTKVLERHLQKAALSEYFSVKHYLGLMGFSYVCKEDQPGLPSPNEELAEIGLPSTWIFHLIFLHKQILNLKGTARQKAEELLAYIQDHAKSFLEAHELPEGQNLIARPTYNLVKVMRMLEHIESYKQEVKRLKEALEREREALEREREALEREREESARKDEALEREQAETARLKKMLGEFHGRPDEEI